MDQATPSKTDDNARNERGQKRCHKDRNNLGELHRRSPTWTVQADRINKFRFALLGVAENRALNRFARQMQVNSPYPSERTAI